MFILNPLTPLFNHDACTQVNHVVTAQVVAALQSLLSIVRRQGPHISQLVANLASAGLGAGQPSAPEHCTQP